MFNDLIDISGFSLHTYGVMTALAFMVGVWLMSREASRVGIEPNLIYEMSFPVLLWSMLGARTLYILTNFSDYISRMKNGDYFAMLRVWEGGLVFYGGFLASIIAGTYYVRKYKLNVYKLMDVITIAVPLSHAIGRLGCFSAGCCYGHATDSAIGIAFPKNSIPYVDEVLAHKITPETLHSLTLHPTQLYEALGLTIIFFILWTYRSRKRFHGEIFLIYVTLYAVERSIVEIFRGDGIRKHIFKFSPDSVTSALGLPQGSPIFMSTSQFIAVLIIIGAFLFRLWMKKKNKAL